MRWGWICLLLAGCSNKPPPMTPFEVRGAGMSWTITPEIFRVERPLTPKGLHQAFTGLLPDFRKCFENDPFFQCGRECWGGRPNGQHLEAIVDVDPTGRVTHVGLDGQLWQTGKLDDPTSMIYCVKHLLEDDDEFPKHDSKQVVRGSIKFIAVVNH